MKNKSIEDFVKQIGAVVCKNSPPSVWAREVSESIESAFLQIGLKTRTLSEFGNAVAVIAIAKGKRSGPSIGFVNSIFQSDSLAKMANGIAQIGTDLESLKISSSLTFLGAQLGVAKQLLTSSDLPNVQFHVCLHQIDSLLSTPTTAIFNSGHKVDAVVSKAAQIGDEIKYFATATGVMIGSIKVEGLATHCGNRATTIRPGGLGDAAGVNALEKGMLVISAIRELDNIWIQTKTHPRLPLASCSIGISAFRADSGQKVPFFIPNLAAIDVRVEYGPHELPTELKEEIERHVNTRVSHDPWLRNHNPRFSWENLYPALDLDPGHKLLTCVQAAVGMLSENKSSSNMQSAVVENSIGSFYSATGTPTVLLGCGSEALSQSYPPTVDLALMKKLATMMIETSIVWAK